MSKDSQLDLKLSYTAAGIFPVKLLLHNGLIREIKETGRIPPVHVQLNPTNRCNMNCSFCSCSARDKQLEMPYEEIAEMMGIFNDLGCKTVTITGGGEPLMHRDIHKILRKIHELGIEIGLVTNGLLLSKLKEDDFETITWCRISSGDNRSFDLRYEIMLEKAIKRGHNVDWSFSHVLTMEPNYSVLDNVIKFANNHNFSHVRIVSDLLDLEHVPNMDEVKARLEELGIDDRLVIYQGRKEFNIGRKDCPLSLLKPVVGADGYIYPCCGTQYALKNPGRDYEKVMRMGHWKDFKKIYERQNAFDGSMCYKCYYDDYNYALNILKTKVKHINFL